MRQSTAAAGSFFHRFSVKVDSDLDFDSCLTLQSRDFIISLVCLTL